MLEYKPDFEQTKERIEAFWRREVLDRPVVMFGLARPPEQQRPMPQKPFTTWEDYWMDIPFQTERALTSVSNQLFLGDTLPVIFPNLGPEVFSGFYGCKLHYGADTSWSEPILSDIRQADQLALDWNSPLLKWLLDMTDALLEVGRGKFITGMPDWHPGGDAIAAFRDPQNLAMDMLDHLDAVKALLQRLEGDYFKVYDLFYEKLRANGQPITSWTPLIADGRYYIPSNDFSIMISKRLFDEVFLPGIQRECQYLQHSIYHLDGPGALRHLDSLLSIPELDALQWVPGAGSKGFGRWVWVYQRAQQAGKGIQVICDISEIPLIMETLDPRGVLLSVGGVPNAEAGQKMLRDLEAWTRRKTGGK